MNASPRILCIGGLDPTGGAGIQADIETVVALGGQPLTLITALTAQDTHDVAAVLPTPVDFFVAQLQRLLGDIRPDAVKIGLIWAPALLPALSELLRGFSGPVVLDPVLAAGGGFELAGAALPERLRDELVPACTLITPNRSEARRLTGCDDPERAAAALLAVGTDAVLVTGADEAEGDRVENRLFLPGRAPRGFTWPRLPHRYHGSGCTLASACAVGLARGQEIPNAVAAAQEFTWQALERAVRPGDGQWLPRRLR